MSILSFNTKVHFGHGERARLFGEMQASRMTRPLFLTDRGVMAAGVFAMATESLAQLTDQVIFDQTPANPTEDAVEAATALFHAKQCDGLIGIGGGATMDLAKAVAVRIGQAVPLWEYCERHPQPRPLHPSPTLLLMPTTAGSGSEVGHSAAILFRHGIKAGINCPNIVSAAICDPELTLTLPERMTAATGMDALTHCVEAFCSPLINPPADAIAIDGIKRMFSSIERATYEGHDRDARWNMMMGALEGAICLQKGLGAVHCISHALGALGYHHGTLKAIMLPHVLRFNAPYILDKMSVMSAAIGLPVDVQLPMVFARLNQRLGLPEGLSDLGIQQEVLGDIATAALADHAHKTNPHALTHEDYLALLNQAW
jgi:4-hydroxybutyrate dehydrogenase